MHACIWMENNTKVNMVLMYMYAKIGRMGSFVWNINSQLLFDICDRIAYNLLNHWYLLVQLKFTKWYKFKLTFSNENRSHRLYGRMFFFLSLEATLMYSISKGSDNVYNVSKRQNVWLVLASFHTSYGWKTWYTHTRFEDKAWHKVSLGVAVV